MDVGYFYFEIICGDDEDGDWRLFGKTSALSLFLLTSWLGLWWTECGYDDVIGGNTRWFFSLYFFTGPSIDCVGETGDLSVSTRHFARPPPTIIELDNTNELPRNDVLNVARRYYYYNAVRRFPTAQSLCVVRLKFSWGLMIKIISNKTCGPPTQKKCDYRHSFSYCLEISAICNGALGTVFDCTVCWPLPWVLLRIGSCLYISEWIINRVVGGRWLRIFREKSYNKWRSIDVNSTNWLRLTAATGADAELNNCKQWRHVPGLTSDRTDGLDSGWREQYLLFSLLVWGLCWVGR